MFFRPTFLFFQKGKLVKYKKHIETYQKTYICMFLDRLFCFSVKGNMTFQKMRPSNDLSSISNLNPSNSTVKLLIALLLI